MKKLFSLLIIFIISISIIGCGDEKNVELTDNESSIEEQETYYEQTEEKENDEITENNTNVIANNDYVIDGEEVKIALIDTDGKIEFYVVGHAKTEEKATLMLSVFLTSFSDLVEVGTLDGYSITVSCGELNVGYLTTDNGYMIFGTNKDGSTVLDKPDWIVTEFTTPEEELDAYTSEILSKLKEFGETYN